MLHTRMEFKNEFTGIMEKDICSTYRFEKWGKSGNTGSE